MVFIKPHLARNWKYLSDPVLLADIDLRNIKQLVVENSIPVTGRASGLLNGFLEYFELDLGPTTRLTTHPGSADETCHWRTPVWVFASPLVLDKGQRFRVTYEYRTSEEKFKLRVSRP